MPFDDMRTFLAQLKTDDQLVHIDSTVDPDVDLAAAANAAGRIGENAPALYFDNLAGFTDARVALNLHGSWRNHAIALGLPPSTTVSDQVDEVARRWERFPVPAQYRTDPPFGQNVLEGEQVDIFRVLPLFRLNERDGGFYIDKAAVISADPTDPEHVGKQNVGIYRLQVKGPDKLGIQPGGVHDIAQHLRLAEERGQNLPIAIAIGVDPITSIVAATPMPYDESEYELAGALRGAPAPIVRMPYAGVDVPWGAEVVLEGVIEGRSREVEGPFGEFTGHYSGGRSMGVIRLHRISYRTDPIFEHLYLGMPWNEIDYLMGPATCVPMLRWLRSDFPEVRTVNAMYTHGLLAIVSTRSRYGGFGKAVGLRAITTPHGLAYCKLVIVVDEDVDPFDLPRVMWALSTKVNGTDDMITLPRMSVLPLDPGADPVGINDKLVIDATTPTAPDRRGRFDHPVKDLAGVDRWLRVLRGESAVPPPDLRSAPAPTGCPRCPSDLIEQVASSEESGQWQAYVCQRCHYGWRSTEPADRRDPAAFPEAFRWTQGDITNAPQLPPVPPLLPPGSSAR